MADTGSFLRPISDLAKSTGVYALAALTTPLVTLLLTPFLAHHLLPAEYGELTLLNAAIGLASGVTQLGLAAAFLRAYSYDFVSPGDRRDVLATVTALLVLTSIPVGLAVTLLAPSIAHLMFHESSLGGLVVLTAGVVLVFNLTVPGFSWLRGENRPFVYSMLAIAQSFVILIGSVVLVGLFRLGVAGALIAIASGYTAVLLCTLPVLLVRSGIRLRADVASSLLAFGLPIALTGVATWVLQLSDRYLLTLFRSLAETGTYAVGYALGSALAIVVITPFQLAWPTAMYAIAKRQDAAELLRVIFRWLGLSLVFFAFGFSLLGTVFLYWLFPVPYHSAASIIPVIAVAWVFYGACAVLTTGANLERKTWLTAAFTAVAAGVNVVCNLILIPSVGAMGAAISTVIAYVALAAMTYFGNQRIHPLPFEIGRFLTAALAASMMYAGSYALPAYVGADWRWPVSILAWIACGAILVLLGRGMGAESRGPASQQNGAKTTEQPDPMDRQGTIIHELDRRSLAPSDLHICMHVLGKARTDVRVMREAAALAQLGLGVSVVDIEHDIRPRQEELKGVRLRHVMMSRRYIRHYEPTHTLRWLVFKAARILRGGLAVFRTSADVYHAHDITALPACYVAARLRRKPLIYDAHELPLVDPHIVGRPILSAFSVTLLRAMMPRCRGIITVSSPIAVELQRRYGGTTAVVVRNIPDYRPPEPSDRIRHHLGLGVETPVVLYQGGLQPDRGLDAAVRAVKFLDRGAVIVLMGQGQARSHLEALIASEEVSDRVKVLPPVAYDELLLWTSSADIGLLINKPDFSANVRMGLPNKLFEYLMAGVPVFVSQLEAVVDLVKSYDVGYVSKSLEPREIGEALNAMLADNERLAQMRRNALTAARKELRWDVEARRLADFYQSLLDVRLKGGRRSEWGSRNE